jgi:cathepsin A (carboxypeptidase C)
VRQLLGIDEHVKEYSASSDIVAAAFRSQQDYRHQTFYYVANLLERGIKVLNVSLPKSTVANFQYVGTLDSACDHIGQSKWMAQMEWTGREGYLAAPIEEWRVDGQVAGEKKRYKDLTVSRKTRQG